MIYAPQQPSFYLRLPKESSELTLNFKKAERRSVILKREMSDPEKGKLFRNYFLSDIWNGLTPSEIIQLFPIYTI